MTSPIEITASAQKQLNQLLINNPGKSILVSVNNKGCSGHSYQWDLVDPQDLKTFDEKITLDEGIFAIAASSMLKLWGSTLDYHSDRFGSQFVWQNPNVKNTCGCGESIGF